MRSRLREWDSAFFGRRIAEVEGGTLDDAAAADILAWCERERVDCLYFLADPEPATIDTAERHGFRLVDVRLTLRRSIRDLEPPTASPWRVRPARGDDLAALEALAAVSHGDSRFYADPRFGSDAASRLYRVWIRNSIEGWADDTLVLTRADAETPLGYITGHRRGDAGQIGLLAVAAEARGAGAASALVTSLCAAYRDAGLDAMTVVTQGRNLDAQRLYQRRGFTSAALGLWYHRWW